MSSRPEGRSKIIYYLDGIGEWTPEETQEYMNRMTRKRAIVIFHTRTRMIKVKGNYKNGHPDQKCRACKNSPETQTHVLYECKALHPGGKPSDDEINPFSKNMNVLKETSMNTEDLLEDFSCPL